MKTQASFAIIVAAAATNVQGGNPLRCPQGNTWGGPGPYCLENNIYSCQHAREYPTSKTTCEHGCTPSLPGVPDTCDARPLETCYLDGRQPCTGCAPTGCPSGETCFSNGMLGCSETHSTTCGVCRPHNRGLKDDFGDDGDKSPHRKLVGLGATHTDVSGNTWSDGTADPGSYVQDTYGHEHYTANTAAGRASTYMRPGSYMGNTYNQYTGAGGFGFDSFNPQDVYLPNNPYGPGGAWYNQANPYNDWRGTPGTNYWSPPSGNWCHHDSDCDSGHCCFLNANYGGCC